MPSNKLLPVMIAVASAAFGQGCVGDGLTLTATGGRLGDPVSAVLFGVPLATGFLSYDATPGPIVTPIGTVCLGLTSALQLLPIALGPTGTLTLSGMAPAAPALSGLTVYLQAAVSDAIQPDGVALSNAASVTLRPPRVILFSQDGPSATKMWTLDSLTDSLSATTTVPLMAPGPYGYIHQALEVADLSLTVLFVRDAAGSQAGFVALNPATYPSNPTLTGISLAIGSALPHRVAVSGTSLFAVYQGSASPSVPGRLVALSLPSNSPFLDLPFANTTVNDVIVPGNGFAYVITTSAIIPVHLATGIPQTAIPVTAPGYVASLWTYADDVIYVASHQSSPGPSDGINAVDLATHTARFPAPVPLPVTGNGLRYGPGTAGNSLFLTATSGVRQLSPSTLTTTAGPVAVANLADMQLSNAGTEWLLLTTPGTVSTSQIHVMTPTTLMVTSTTVAGVASKLVVLPSASLNKAYLVEQTFPHAVIAFGTDPVASPSSSPPYVPAGLFAPVIAVVN